MGSLITNKLYLNYMFLIFLSTLVISNNLIIFFISWIGLNISLYGILLRKPNLRSSEMVIKYFISGAILTVFLIFALLLHFIQYFSFSIDMVSFLNANFEIPENIMFIDKLVYSIIISIILFKLGAFPFHFYLEDIYGILHFRNSIFIYTITLKLLMFVLLLKVINSFWFFGDYVEIVLIYSGLGSIAVSSYTLILQHNLRKFLANSYLNSVGFILIAIAFGVFSNFGELSLITSKIYIIVYMIVWVGVIQIIESVLFLKTVTTIKEIKNEDDEKLEVVAFAFEKREIIGISDLSVLGNFSNNYNFEKKSTQLSKISEIFDKIAEMLQIIAIGRGEDRSYRQSTDFLRFALFVFILSLMGLPTTIGFFSKSLIFLQLATNSSYVGILIFMLCCTVLASYGYLKILTHIILPATKNKQFIFGNKYVFQNINETRDNFAENLENNMFKISINPRNNLAIFGILAITLVLPTVCVILFFLSDSGWFSGKFSNTDLMGVGIEKMGECVYTLASFYDSNIKILNLFYVFDFNTYNYYNPKPIEFEKWEESFYGSLSNCRESIFDNEGYLTDTYVVGSNSLNSEQDFISISLELDAIENDFLLHKKMIDASLRKMEWAPDLFTAEYNMITFGQKEVFARLDGLISQLEYKPENEAAINYKLINDSIQGDNFIQILDLAEKKVVLEENVSDAIVLGDSEKKPNIEELEILEPTAGVDLQEITLEGLVDELDAIKDGELFLTEELQLQAENKFLSYLDNLEYRQLFSWAELINLDNANYISFVSMSKSQCYLEDKPFLLDVYLNNSVEGEILGLGEKNILWNNLDKNPHIVRLFAIGDELPLSLKLTWSNAQYFKNPIKSARWFVEAFEYWVNADKLSLSKDTAFKLRDFTELEKGGELIKLSAYTSFLNDAECTEDILRKFSQPLDLSNYKSIESLRFSSYANKSNEIQYTTQTQLIDLLSLIKIFIKRVVKYFIKIAMCWGNVY